VRQGSHPLRKEREMSTALVIVDMLRDFVHGRLANAAARPIIERIGELAEAARGREDWIVVYGNDAHRPGDVELRLFGEHAMAGTPGAEVVDQLAPAGGDIVVPKRYYSAFTQTDLEATCLVHDVGRVVIVGQHTDCCVRHTSYDAFMRGLEVVVPADATAVFQPLSEEAVAARQERALEYLRTFYGVSVVSTADLLG
jgi:nicotinamidase-related amidase